MATPVYLALSRPQHLSAITKLPACLRTFSVLNRPSPNYPGHVPLTHIERGALAIGSALWSYVDPTRGDLIAALGEATAQPYFITKLRDTMLSHPTGRRLLKDRPRITSKSLNVEYLRSLPENTVGRVYVGWLDREGVTPDTRSAVRYIDDPECAYVMQRYRECHDFYHALVGLPVIREGEVALKAFEFANLGIPMTGLSVFAVTTLKRKAFQRFWEVYGPWAVRNGVNSESVLNVYWEEELETDVQALRERLGIEMPPDLREIRRAEREKSKKEKERSASAGAS
ncbi:ubiquinone biosynthesis protein COQ4, mitochondrial [Pseudovirgaria hyperparasitica]|uniref:4-hydroxy-3-methoxy-5-polyprenylbenzoate decarboxylase n=1 Tax=Pseudovirgaria hyperparasitica TaxID=470096 RepID=A0A6A6W8Z1_9PEZI|nr:ubiquinone biosynthesis protein COQ4, mitochondrial [Pseudovirgaria hyperparasitica]KAF2757561.1 ubiquinone biosynthesis protein COQ4, mitochondrial [Pseudovirgaria hyperparasitica]